MNVTVATNERAEPRDKPQTPCPLVHPPAYRVPSPTIKPALMIIGQLASIVGKNFQPSKEAIDGANSMPPRNASRAHRLRHATSRRRYR